MFLVKSDFVTNFVLNDFMKNILWLSLVLLILNTSCKRKNTDIETPLQADITFQFKNYVNDKEVEYSNLDYINLAGNKFSVTLLKYYISNVILVREDLTEVKLNNYDLMDAFSPDNFSTIDGKNIPNGHYKWMRFNMGVDSMRNHTLANDGELDPIYGMIWDWNTGYIFFKHEGLCIKPNGDTTLLQYHLGTDPALSQIMIPIDILVEGTKKIATIRFDLNKMYDNPIINFDDKYIHHSTLASEKQWISDMVVNTENAFSFVGVK